METYVRLFRDELGLAWGEGQPIQRMFDCRNSGDGGLGCMDGDISLGIDSVWMGASQNSNTTAMQTAGGECGIGLKRIT